MIQDADRVARGTTLDADICIVGAGPVGIAIALALSERLKGLRGHGAAAPQLLLLEAGRRRQDADAQALYRGELANPLHSPPERYRLRGLGGSSTLWGGRCLPLDPIDMEVRPWVPMGGWPIRYEALLDYYAEANALAEAGRFAYQADEALGPLPPMVPGLVSDVVRTDSLERFSCPTDFGRRYARRLREAPGLRVLRGAVCTAIRLAPSGASVAALEVATLAGNVLRVRPRITVLALGGLETARLLLASDDVQPWGVGNRHDVVGRYYMCHIAGSVGQLEIAGSPRGVRHGYERSHDGVYCRRRLTIAAPWQRKMGLLNAVARLHFPRITDPTHGSGVLSSLFLARNFIGYEYGRRLRDDTPETPALLARHLANVARDVPDTAAFLAHWLARRSLATRKFPSVILPNRTNHFSLELQGEQLPDAASRVTLGNRVDALGMRCLRIDWRYRKEDISSLQKTLELFAAEFARTGAGRLRWDAGRLEEDLLRFGAYGGHHIGTARMGRDPRTSVVDADCRVHGMEDLYVAGSAVFPTSGQANPTLTALALGLRLAQHLTMRLQPQRASALQVTC